MTARTLAALLTLLAVAGPVSAAIDADWAEVATASDGQCTLTVTGNGQAYRIAVSGLEPGAAGRYFLTNGNMKPIDWTIRADGNGTFARYYMPFRWGERGGTVGVAVDADDCSVSASFPWRRAEVRVH